MSNQRNFILAAVLSLAVVFLWQAFIINPRLERERLAAEQQQAAQDALKKQAGEAGAPTAGATGDGAVPSAGAGAIPSAPAPAAPAATTTQAQADVGRVVFKSGKLNGSINLRGARIDDLNLALYRETVDPTSPEITLLRPVGEEGAYFAEFGFSPNAQAGELPGRGTIWRQVGSNELAPGSPVTLEYKNDRGLTFTRTVALDEDYMFTITDAVTNESGTTVSIAPYGRIARLGRPQTEGIFVLHEGLIGSVGDQGLDEIDYGDVEDDPAINRPRAESGWLGITDKYWATALVPGTPFVSRYTHTPGAIPVYQSDYLGDAIAVPAGGEASVTNRLFAGAKKVEIIDAYEADGIPFFSNLIDWGWFYFITKPLFGLMNLVFAYVGNFGVAILLVTVLIKIAFFPLANKSYASMANMKKVQPEMMAIKERFPTGPEVPDAQKTANRQASQKAMMELYKEKKINPAAGCWPVLIQIPVFFALYKVIYVTIEMRHAPFFGWIQDLSAPDPTSIFNLFGLLPYDVPLLLMIGVWPLLMGITMFVQMQMNPAPPDPTQQMIFKWLPVVFTFMLATFPAGLVIYWAWNNFLSILQQGAIMKRQGAKIELWDNLKGIFGKKKAET
ncbi:MAG: membrane protein insertase YidC [Pseudomonadota bacterium]